MHKEGHTIPLGVVGVDSDRATTQREGRPSGVHVIIATAKVRFLWQDMMLMSS
jgi:hypothetical protein